VPQLQPYLLAVFVPLVVLLVMRYPLHVMLLANILLVAVPGEWQIAGLRFGPGDLMLLAILGNLATTGQIAGLWRNLPFRWPWLGLVLLTSVSYLAAPINQIYLTDPVRIVYQLFRYAWKLLLFYPMASLLLADDRPMMRFRMTVVAAGAIVSVQAALEGYAGLRANGPFIGANALGGALLIPLLLSWASVLQGGSRRWVLAHLAAFALCVRGLLFSGSRGAFVASIVGLSCLTWWLRADPGARRRVGRLVVATPFLVLALFLVKPDLLERPTIQRMMSASEGTEASTFEWRMEERWPYFWNRALERPLVGWGTSVDQSLGRRGNTPHNGYLGLAVTRGFPALALFLVFVAIGIRQGLKVRRRAGPADRRVVGAVCAAIMMALLIHDITDEIFEIPFVEKLTWCLLAITVRISRPQSLP